MLGEARSHSSALLLGAAGDWRRVTSPLPRRGRRAAPAIFGSRTNAYRQEARAVPPQRAHRPREGERARAEPALPAAETPSPLHGRGAQPYGQLGIPGPRSTDEPAPGLAGSWLTGRGGWWQRGGRWRGADATFHARCRHPAPRQGSRTATDLPAPRSCPPLRTTLTTPSRLSIPRYRCIANGLGRPHPVSRDGVSPPLQRPIPTSLHPCGGPRRGAGNPPPRADWGQQPSRAAQEHPRTRASPAASPERVPSTSPPPEGTVQLPTGGTAPRVPRWDLGFQLLNANRAWDADARPAGETLPSKPVGDVPGAGMSQPLRRTHAWPGLPGQRKIGQARQLAAPVSDREAGGEPHARLSIASQSHGRLAATAANRPPALPSCHPPRHRPPCPPGPAPGAARKAAGRCFADPPRLGSPQIPNPLTLSTFSFRVPAAESTRATETAVLN